MRPFLVLLLLLSGIVSYAQADKAPRSYDIPPEYPGGMAAVQQYLSKSVKYPEPARKANIQGRVEVRYSVNDQGAVTEVSILKAVHPLLDKEALRVVKAMPKWKPATLDGKKVKVVMAMPIVFELKDAVRR